MDKVNFAILGCGKIGSRHAAKLKSVEGANLVAVYDIIPERAEKIAAEHSCRHYRSIEDLLNDSEIDFVNVCTPSGFHKEHTIRALNAGKNVLCEKPMGFQEIDALAMVEAARRNNKLLFVVKQNRFNPPFKLVNRLMKEGRLGEPVKCVVNIYWNRNEDYYKSDPWRGTLLLDGGTIFTQASHFVDLMLALMGKPKYLTAFMARRKHPIEIEDTGVIAIEFESGALGSFNYTTCATKKNFEGSLTIIGTKGTVKIGGEYLNTIDYFQVEGMDSYELEDDSAEADDYGTYKGSMSNHDKVFEAIVAQVNGERMDENLVLGDEAIYVVRFIERAIQSAKTGQRIYF